MRFATPCLVCLVLLLGLCCIACPAGQFDSMPDCSPADRAVAEKLWRGYLDALGNRKWVKQPERLAVFFLPALIASTDEKTFAKSLVDARRKMATGLLDAAQIESLKQAPGGLLLVIDSKAGEVGVPLARTGERMLLADIAMATGEWTAEGVHFSGKMPAEPSLLYLKMMLADEKQPVGDRLRAAVNLAKTEYRQEIIRHQRMVQDRIVRLGLGLARVRIDGFDESFLKNFPTDASGLSALKSADAEIFEEMLTKLANQGAMVEDPPANEVLYKVVAGSPAPMRERMGKAIYDMAEMSPVRFANAVRNAGAKDLSKDATLAIYLEEVKRRGGKSPKVSAFLKKFSRQGEPVERALCGSILSQLQKAR
ncbi:MAG: hypothetical protein JXR96_29090 [Deltaproteobacteria bacterium]|nr:hypothetical protein [Deltaproteobacteria bacterium]